MLLLSSSLSWPHFDTYIQHLLHHELAGYLACHNTKLEREAKKSLLLYQLRDFSSYEYLMLYIITNTENKKMKCLSDVLDQQHDIVKGAVTAH